MPFLNCHKKHKNAQKNKCMTAAQISNRDYRCQKSNQFESGNAGAIFVFFVAIAHFTMSLQSWGRGDQRWWQASWKHAHVA